MKNYSSDQATFFHCSVVLRSPHKLIVGVLSGGHGVSMDILTELWLCSPISNKIQHTLYFDTFLSDQQKCISAFKLQSVGLDHTAQPSLPTGISEPQLSLTLDPITCSDEC
ncbi:hypothetical protein ATANTOWER_021462 [Ataeniobius toweri]|uniref:Uncharacterized protein n=1 Tax=Ataeniobius toweri TaxID=208326 RepID=A0ABU7B1C7_9TELE|nr:hypothetical protein [Ataeniobius toweri]